MLLLSTVPPQKVGAYTGSQLTTSGLGKGEKIMWEYDDSAAGRTMSLVSTTVAHEKMLANLEGTGKTLGSIGSCGYLYGNTSTPTCLVRLEGGSNLSVNGDAGATLDETRAFTSAFLALAKTR